MSSFPKTILELYDDEPILNILASAEFKPENVVFLGSKKMLNSKNKNNIISTIKRLKLNTKCFFYFADFMNLDSVTEEIRKIIDTFKDIAIDITGGNEIALVAIGIISKENSLPLFRFDKFSNTYTNINMSENSYIKKISSKFKIEPLLMLSGSVIKSHGHLSLDSIDNQTADDIYKIWGVYKKHSLTWHKVVSYLQQISKNIPQNSLEVNASSVIYGGEWIVGVDNKVFNELSELNLIKNFSKDRNRVRFSYKNNLIKSCLCDAGICLELYVFAVAYSSGLFDDVKISVVIDWDGKLNSHINTINEIDVMMSVGYIPIFVSCKSGSPNVTALNEIKTLSRQFGGKFAKAVLVTMADVSTRDKYLYQRAIDMGVEIIDRNDILMGKLEKKLNLLAKL